MVVTTTQRFPRRTSGRPPSADSATRREDILNTAAELFSAEGYRGMSMSRIARACGMSQTGLVHHFPSKDDLLQSVLDRRDNLDRTYFRPAGIDPPRGWNALSSFVDLVRNNQNQPGMVALFTTVAGEAVDPDHPANSWLRGHHRNATEHIRSMLAEAAQDGRLVEGAPVESIIRNLIAAMDGLQIQWLSDPDYTDMATDLEILLDALRNRWEAHGPATLAPTIPHHEETPWVN